MKRKILTFALLFSLFTVAEAQELPIDASTEKVTFMEVVDADGLSAKELYKVMKDWAIAKELKVEEDNAGDKEIIFKGVMSVPYERVKGRPEISNVNFKFYLFAKENKYRYIVTDFVHEGSNTTMSGGKMENETPECGPSVSQVNWTLIKKKTKSGMDEMIEDLKKKVKAAQNDPTKKKDW